MEQLTFEEEVQRITLLLNKKMDTKVRERLLNEGITRFQYHILLLIERSEQVGVTELASEMHVSPSAITPVITRLYELNLVHRYHSKEDRRKVIIEITEKGRKIVKEANQHVQTTIRELFSNYEEEDQQQFLRLCEKLNKNM
ncbi:MarR family winged helix-turn-helix transcriptional regulator [Priestia megaterium]|uniref:MarR family winged helix-turn-helix transcriptional regulator n=1 Tax=Priestia megaterium TaxID=1404 RepID=UPI0038799C16